MPQSIPSGPIATLGACSSGSSRSESAARSHRSSSPISRPARSARSSAMPSIERKGTIGTRNCRLAAIRSFFNFVASKEPTCDRAVHRGPRRSDQARIDPGALLSRAEGGGGDPRCSPTGRRWKDCATMRCCPSSTTVVRASRRRSISRPEAIRFEAPNCVRLYGKGRKERICPLWPETVLLLKKLLERQPRASNERMFVNRYGEPLGASGVRFKLAGLRGGRRRKRCRRSGPRP